MAANSRKYAALIVFIHHHLSSLKINSSLVMVLLLEERIVSLCTCLPGFTDVGRAVSDAQKYYAYVLLGQRIRTAQEIKKLNHGTICNHVVQHFAGSRNLSQCHGGLEKIEDADRSAAQIFYRTEV